MIALFVTELPILSVVITVVTVDEVAVVPVCVEHDPMVLSQSPLLIRRHHIWCVTESVISMPFVTAAVCVSTRSNMARVPLTVPTIHVPIPCIIFSTEFAILWINGVEEARIEAVVEAVVEENIVVIEASELNSEPSDEIWLSIDGSTRRSDSKAADVEAFAAVVDAARANWLKSIF